MSTKKTATKGKRRPKTPIGAHIKASWPKHPKAMKKLK